MAKKKPVKKAAPGKTGIKRKTPRAKVQPSEPACDFSEAMERVGGDVVLYAIFHFMWEVLSPSDWRLFDKLITRQGCLGKLRRRHGALEYRYEQGSSQVVVSLSASLYFPGGCSPQGWGGVNSGWLHPRQFAGLRSAHDSWIFPSSSKAGG